MAYFYAPGRAGENAETFLPGFDGILQISKREADGKRRLRPIDVPLATARPVALAIGVCRFSEII